MEKLKELLRKECDMVPGDDTLDSFLALGSEAAFADKEVITGYGDNDSNLYVVKEGIISIADMDGDKERVVAFGCPGTVYSSKHSFVKGQPSYYEIRACGHTVLIKIPREAISRWIRECHEGAIWLMRLALEELYFIEYNNATVHNGTGRERFEALMNTRPEILGKVQQKQLASYLHITPEYLCRIKKRYLKK